MKPILFTSFLLAACATEAPRSAPTTDQWESYLGPNDDHEEQGRFLLGNFADSLKSGGAHYFVNDDGFTGDKSVTVSVVNNRLAATHPDGEAFEDQDFVGMEFTFATRRLRITGVGTDDETQHFGYVLEYFNGSDWKPYCDSAKSEYAVPMKGAWTADREHVDGPRLSFGCLQSGVSAKCIEWGYSPGSDGPTSSAWKQHQTCTQVAAADYCNVGIPRTRELTPIVIRDFVTNTKPHPTEEPTLPILDPTETWPPPDDYYVEAAWRYDGPAMCLSKLRWASLPPGGYCPALLPDPRDPDNQGVKYCDDIPLTELAKNGARLYTASLFMDAPAYSWRTANGEALTSVDGYVEGSMAHSSPFEGEASYSLVNPTPSYILLRNLPGSVDPSEVTALYKQHNPNTGDRVIAPINPQTLKGVTVGHVVDTQSRAEGYMFDEWRPGLGTTQPLKLFRKGSDYVTALTQPANYTFVQDLGWVMAP